MTHRKDWTLYEKIWLIAFLVVILAATVYFSWTDTDYADIDSVLLNWVISPLSAISGIFCVVLAAKGRFSNWVWGIANSVLYGYLAYRTGYYGDALMGIAYFLPTQFIGIFAWKRMMRKDKAEQVRMRKLTWRQALGFGAAGVVATVLFALLLHTVDNWFTRIMHRNDTIYAYFVQVFGERFALLGPIIDSSTEVLQFFAQILMIMALAEQWVFWILTNLITIGMWAIVIIADPASISWALPTLIMWVAYLVNSIYGLCIWMRGAKRHAHGAVSG